MIALALALSAAAALRYEVTASAGARVLTVDAQIAAFPDRSGELSVNGGAEEFVRDVAMLSAKGALPLERRGDSWFAPGCAARGCKVRYSFALREAAAARNDDDVATLYGDVVESPPGAWLLRPMHATANAKAELIVTMPEGLRFAAGLPRGPLTVGAIAQLPYAAFGDLRVEKLDLDGVSVTVAIAKGPRRQTGEELLSWLRDSAALTASYFGRFPADGALLLVLPAAGDGVHGRARGTGGASILFFLGTDLTDAQARESWELVHELVHLGFPSLRREHHWAEEGLSTYAEPIARARAGELSAAKVWGDLVRGLPQGLPRPGDEGLDRTQAWGRTYWGGALFWLLADVQIRERTGNRRGLEHALRAVVSHGGSIAENWPLRRVLEVGDRAVGTTVLQELYTKLGTAPGDVDLETLFRKLGVVSHDGSVEFDDRAPLANIRRVITGGQ